MSVVLVNRCARCVGARANAADLEAHANAADLAINKQRVSMTLDTGIAPRLHPRLLKN